MKKHRNIFQMEEQDKTQEKKPSEMEIINLPDRDFKLMVRKMSAKLGQRMDENWTSIKDRKYKRAPNRSHRAEEYDN